ncbi:MAG: lipopolysaccharide biosynthesis protein [Actinobacteria bacterium]|nr:lipopolysaccharide biosynthesis protein [Actinomycetota bacterium]
MSDDGWQRRLRSGIFWSTAAFVGSKAITLVSTLILTRLLVPSEFGVVSAILVYTGLLELASDLGLSATVVYEQEQGVTRRVQTAFTINVALGALLATLAFVFAPVVAGFFHISTDIGLFRLSALSLLITGFGGIPDALLLRDMQFNKRIVAQLTRGGVRGIVSIVLAAIGFGASALVIGLLAGAFVGVVVTWILTRFRPTFAFERAAVRGMLTYGGASSVLEVMALLGGKVDVAAVGRVLGTTALGLYTIAFRVPELVIETVAWNVSAVAFPALARKRIEHHEGLGTASLKLVRYQALYALPAAAGMAILAVPLVVVAFSERWRGAAGVTAAIAIMSGISATVFPLGDLFKAVGRQRILVALNVIGLPLTAVAIILAAPYGITAVAWTRVGQLVLHAFLVFLFATRVVDVGWRNIFDTLRPALLCSIGVVVGAGAVRLAWPDASLGPLLAGTLAGTLGGAVALRTLARADWDDLRVQLGHVVPARFTRARRAEV